MIAIIFHIIVLIYGGFGLVCDFTGGKWSIWGKMFIRFTAMYLVAYSANQLYQLIF